MFWAIKHKPSGFFLPTRSQGRNRGYTHDEPTADKPPRLFTSERNAKLALGEWLKGPLHVSQYQDWQGDWDESWERGKHNRKADDMVIVEITIQERLP